MNKPRLSETERIQIAYQRLDFEEARRLEYKTRYEKPLIYRVPYNMLHLQELKRPQVLKGEFEGWGDL
jgi:hypothetical protein